MAAVSALLSSRIGLDPGSLGSSAIADAIAARCASLGLANTEQYPDRLHSDRREFQQLVEQLMVRETWFFRGPALFDYLSRSIHETARSEPGRTFKVLSIPCSTGEEPYSLAISLAERQVPADRVRIDGVDLSTTAIAGAQSGVYRDFAFRQIVPAIRDRYFTPHQQGHLLGRVIRDRVRFWQGNILDPNLSVTLGARYDVVFCRNLLIYLTPSSRQTAVDRLFDLLTPGGLLAVGPAEPTVLTGRMVRPIGPTELFLFERVGEASRLTTVHQALSSPSQRFASNDSQSSLQTSPPLPKQPVSIVLEPPKARNEATAPSSSQIQDLTEVRQLANAGRLSEARQICQTILAGNPTADGYALLGIILQAHEELDGSADAIRRALYLDPNHREALTLALSMALATGQTTVADGLRARLQKLPAEVHS